MALSSVVIVGAASGSLGAGVKIYRDSRRKKEVKGSDGKGIVRRAIQNIRLVHAKLQALTLEAMAPFVSDKHRADY